MIMDKKYKRIAREQLDQNIQRLQPLKNINVPLKGWIKAVRESIGMTSTQLAKRLGVSQPRVTQIEKEEINGSLTINMMRKVAEALNCNYYYSILPLEENLETLLRIRVTLIVKKKYENVKHTMKLEAQGLDEFSMNKEIEHAVKEIMRELPKTIWEDNI